MTRIISFFVLCLAFAFSATATAQVSCQSRQEALKEVQEDYGEQVVWRGIVKDFNAKFVQSFVSPEFYWVFVSGSLIEITGNIKANTEEQNWTMFVSGPRPGSPLCFFAGGRGVFMIKNSAGDVIEFRAPTGEVVVMLVRTENLWTMISVKGPFVRGEFWENIIPQNTKPDEL